MGYDTSFHAIPVDLVRERLTPYLLGEGNIDDLVAQAVHLVRVRTRVKAWGLALHRLDPRPRRFEPFFHLWGRPFFIAVDDLDDALDAYDLYTQASLEQADALLFEQLGAVAPGLVDAVRAQFTPPPVVADASLREDLLWRLEILRASIEALRQGRTQIEANGRSHDPAALLRREVPFAVLSFCAALAPGWMSRGKTWPSALLDAVPLPTRPFFEAPGALLGALPQRMPSQPWFLYPTIVENYMVGGLVAPGYVALLRRYLADHAGALLSQRSDEELLASRVELRKVDEALALAQRRGWAFCEASEIYSGMEGHIN